MTRAVQGAAQGAVGAVGTVGRPYEVCSEDGHQATKGIRFHTRDLAGDADGILIEAASGACRRICAGGVHGGVS